MKWFPAIKVKTWWRNSQFVCLFVFLEQKMRIYRHDAFKKISPATYSKTILFRYYKFMDLIRLES
jgi:hypothetical protein